MSFDEVSLDGTVSYDPALDQIFGPNKNAMVVFARGLFSKWKQPVYYGYDEILNMTSIRSIVQEVHDAGLNILCFTCDSAPSNRSTWNKLGVTYEKPHFENHVTGKPIYCFADPPHLIKLLRNNLFDSGFRLQDGTLIEKKVFVDLSLYNNREHRVCHKFTSGHLDVVGAERMNVRVACETISRSVASAIEMYFPRKRRVAEFIRLANDFFDIMNSRIKNDPIKLKRSFGVHLESQTRILDQFYIEILNMRCIGSSFMLPFQRGILQSINALKLMFADLRSSTLKIKYLNVNRINQDIAENAFGIIRSMGRSNVAPNAVDFKYRLRYLCLTWHLLVARPTCPVLNNEYILDDDEVIFSTKIAPLLIGRDEVQPTPPPIPENIEQMLCELTLEVSVNSENWTRVNENMRLSERCEFGGQDNLAGFIAKKLSKKFPGLVLTAPEKVREPLSWSQHISNGGLHVPSYTLLNLTRDWNKYFLIFHNSTSAKVKVNRMRRVTSTLSSRISADFPSFDSELIEAYVKMRTFIRIQFLNEKIKQKKHKNRNLRKKKQFVKSQQPNLSESESESEVSD